MGRQEGAARISAVVVLLVFVFETNRPRDLALVATAAADTAAPHLHLIFLVLKMLEDRPPPAEVRGGGEEGEES